MSRVIAFHGVDSKVGTTMISQSTAELIAGEMKELRVMLITCNGRSSTSYVPEGGETMANIRIGLDSRVLSVKDLLQNCRRTDNFYVLGGSSSVNRERRYHPEMVSYMLDRLKNDLDLIFTDCGGELDDGLAIGALREAQEAYCVLTQQESGLVRYEKLKDWYGKLRIFFGGFIVNKYRGDDPYQIRDLAKRMGEEESRFLQIIESDYARRAEMERRTLLNYRNVKYMEDIKCIANCILKGAGFLPIESRKKSFWKTSI